MPAESLLANFPVLRTRDPGQLRDLFQPLLSMQALSVPDADNQFDCVVNHCNLRSIALTYLSYGAAFSCRLGHGDFYLQGFPVSGSGEVRWNRSVVAVGPQRGSVCEPGADLAVSYDGSFAHLVTRISPAALTQRLSQLVGRPVDRPLRLTGRIDPEAAGAHWRLVHFLVQEVNRLQGRLPEFVLTELEDAVLVSYLLTNEHNHSVLLRGAPPSAAPWQVRRAVEYMEQHWDQAVTIDKLTQITGTSARSLFHLFRKAHDVSPMVYLGRLRLQRAREMLSRPGPDTSVTQVGYHCGFSNLGNFAMKYYAAFGERPSQTLRSHLK